MKAMMVDIETLGLTTGSLVVQIGVCAANLRTGQYLYEPTNIHLTPAIGSVDAQTVMWWMRQSDKARYSVFAEEVVRWAPREAFNMLQAMYGSLCTVGADKPDVTVWASPAMFDMPLLASYFLNNGCAKGDARPWPYYMERDLMTLYKMLDPEKQLKPANPLEHDAASDAKAQMDHLIAIFQANPSILEGAI